MINHLSASDLRRGATQKFEIGPSMHIDEFYIELWWRGRVTATKDPWGVKLWWNASWKRHYFRYLHHAQEFYEERIREAALRQAERVLDL